MIEIEDDVLYLTIYKSHQVITESHDYTTKPTIFL